MRVWVVIALVCIGGTAAAREPRRKTAGRPAAAPAPAVTPAEPQAPKPKRGFDEDSCGTCRSWRNYRREDPPPVPVPTTTLTGTEVVDGFRGVERTVQECRAANVRPDPINVHAAIAKDGKVSAVAVKGQLAPPTAACIENAVKAAHFRASSGLAADYVFLYRRFESGGGQAARDGGVDGSRDTAGQ